MFRIYALIFVIAIIGGIGYGAKYYYDTTQATIATLRDNNAKLETAVQTAEQSVETLKGDMAKLGELNNQLQVSLQKAEAYGDELRRKLSDLDLVVEALKNSKSLEGKMNGATAKLWREFMGDTGGNGDRALPEWLLPVPSGTGDTSSNEGGEGANTSGGETKTTPAK